MSKNKITKKGNAPSKEEAESAMNIIKLREVDKDKDGQVRELQEEREREIAIIQEQERIQAEHIRVAQDEVRRRLRENLKQKKEAEKITINKNFLESGNKISWKVNPSGKISGYFKEKLVFEIVRGLTLFSLYVKDSKLLETHKFKTQYIGCSSFIQKLKSKSEKLI